MSDPMASREKIRREGREAAEQGRPATDCPYPRGSGASKQWFSAYLTRELELDAEQEQAA